MKFKIISNEWWGAPKKFSTELTERKISWSELFYDLVYVIAIAKITHHLLVNLSYHNLLEYVYFFGIILWGWFNGSIYHDIHASTGLRTRLMTLWQMLIVAALAVAIDSPADQFVFNVTVVLLVMQIYITYLWWSIGFYDKSHRKRNLPFLILYLISFGLMFSTLYLKGTFLIQTILTTSLIINYLTPFIANKLVRREFSSLNLSASMSERLGLFTIIVFGEVIAGVINGISELHNLLNIWTCVNFGLAVFIVFALWWLFFTLISDRKCKPGVVNSTFLEVLYLPTLIGLGLLGMSFNGLFEKYDQVQGNFLSLKTIFGCAMCLFLLGVNLMMSFLEYAEKYQVLRRKARFLIFTAIIILLTITIVDLNVSLFVYLLMVLTVILSIIFLMNYNWYVNYASNTQQSEE